ncbi:hypothetical protein CFN78_18735 [Amycolatopsis antarctica]|uniref:Probable 2-phosphosulfolactate phosphatase n=2 Tax=Amycolatopsis antarctica TaxID=1854586 RepID=A0A263CZT8_9PSEU|nr:hypothetical protein CFN78_18735 [Amycolatopsis antarctica]
MDVFGQAGHDIRMEWSMEGISALAADCVVLVVVDVLAFSTTVDLALHRGSRVRPVRWDDPADVAAAKAEGATVPDERGWKLRPSTVHTTAPGTYLALPSPNGAALSKAAADTGRHVLTGCLRNARAVARLARTLAEDAPIGVIPAGERWGVDLAGTHTEGPLRPCAEDHLGAGAIVDALIALGVQWPSPEASLAARAFRAAGPDVGAVVAGSSSGQELRAKGLGADVDLAIAVNRSEVAPFLVRGDFVDVATH